MTVSRVRFKRTDLESSRFIAGCWRLTQWNKGRGELGRWIRACFDLGITTFDLAPVYGQGECERLFGEALDPQSREAIQIITKCGIRPRSSSNPGVRVKHYDTSATHIVASAENSLRELRTDHIDLLLIHRPDPLLAADEVASAFHRLGTAGKVRYFGVSNFTPTQFSLLSSAVGQPLVTNQIQINLGHLKPLDDGSLDQLQTLGIPPLAWSPLGGGAIVTGAEPHWQRIQQALDRIAARLDATREQIALAWLLRHPAGIVPILGTGNLERMESQILAERISLDRQDWFELLEASTGTSVP